MSDETRESVRDVGGRPKRARGVSTTSPEAGPAWSIRGVAPNVRAIAVREATARGATVGDWVSEAIVRHARGAEPSDQTPVSSDGQALATVAPAAADQSPDPGTMVAVQERLVRAVERQTREMRRGRWSRRR
jgi:hypothetical protein